ncbi:drug/metabolite transporter (DMT)-like permease [Clostridium acetobutylicum]|nr:drug/metabolite transporter (DMT)-like permease [Clostridium acetobutylicum]
MTNENIVDSNLRKKGLIFAVLASTLWGISGIAAQYLFQMEDFSPEWLVVIRLIISGVLLLAATYVATKKKYI